MSKAIYRADKFVGTKCKIYYPWRQKFIHRVVHKDQEGYYVLYKNEKKRLRLALNEFGDFVRFEMLHGEKLAYVKATRHNKCLECHNFCNGCDGDVEPCEAFEYAKY